MAKATLTLANGTTVQVDGTPEEIQHLLEFYGGATPAQARGTPTTVRKRTRAKRDKREPERQSGPDLSEIVNLIKNGDEAEAIEQHILDRTSMVDRCLLPLYIVHEHLKNAFGLTSGDINRITTELGIPIRTPHASTTLSHTAKRYVMGDKMRRKGVPVRYRLSRRGVQYMKSVLSGGNEK